MRLSIDHHTGFSYSAAVKASYNEARLTPSGSSGQTVWSSRIVVDPSAWSYTYTDYWGTLVTTFEVHEPHERLTVTAQAMVDTSDDVAWDESDAADPADLGWEQLGDRSAIDSMTELLTLRERTQPPEELMELLSGARSLPPRQAALQVCRTIHSRLEYAPGATTVASSAADAWAAGGGVCQDFSHVALGALRALGLPARYVSGYLHPGGGQPGKAVTGESHSWIEWWAGSWVAYDPTLCRRITDAYVKVGHGRDYADVAPLRGTYSGGPSEMFVSVTMTQLD